MKKEKIILSGMRPTGKLHLGHLVGALANWTKLQDEYKCYFMVADWHAYMSEYKDPGRLSDVIYDNVADWLVWGVDPERSAVFVQSQVQQHLELFMILSLITPLGWLTRCPTFKEQLQQLKEKEINTYAFLGYPALQAADILLYNATHVPVGEDQLPHLELTREIVRRFHHLYGEKVLKEPQPLLTVNARLPGLDGRKMSKSYNNYIALDEDDTGINEKVMSMYTDPQRVRKNDPGHPEGCSVFSYYKVFLTERAEETETACRKGEIGCRECKTILQNTLKQMIAPRREEKKSILKDKDLVYNILKDGREKASAAASLTIGSVKKAMKI